MNEFAHKNTYKGAILTFDKKKSMLILGISYIIPEKKCLIKIRISGENMTQILVKKKQNS